MIKERAMFHHISVLLEETIEGLNIKEDGIYVDCTLGGGGHSKEILRRLTSGHLYCFDQDQTAIEAANQRLSQISDHYTIIHSNFKNLKSELNALGITHVDGIVFDLGVSSPQFDDGERGFSYNYDAKLDMRMDQKQILSAYEIVNTYDFHDLVKILYKYSEEKFAKQIARNIEKHRQEKPIETTFELVEIIKEAIPAPARRKGGHPAKRTFQAIRIEVNEELDGLDKCLKDIGRGWKVGGRLAVITFHSLEDRIVKQTFKDLETDCICDKRLPVCVCGKKREIKQINKKPIEASESERKNNPRSASAKLRIIEKI